MLCQKLENDINSATMSRLRRSPPRAAASAPGPGESLAVHVTVLPCCSAGGWPTVAAHYLDSDGKNKEEREIMDATGSRGLGANFTPKERRGGRRSRSDH